MGGPNYILLKIKQVYTNLNFFQKKNLGKYLKINNSYIIRFVL